MKLNISIFLSSLTLLINPFYLLIIGSLIETRIKLKSFFIIFLAISISLSMSNRDIGGSWYGSNGEIGIDDGYNYSKYYNSLEQDSYILDPISYIPNLLEGKEPLWYIIAEVSGLISGFNIEFLKFFSVFIPIILIHFSFLKFGKSFCTIGVVFFFLTPEVFHTIFHLWRLSLATSIAYLLFAISIKKKINFIKIFSPVFAHISSLALFPVLWSPYKNNNIESWSLLKKTYSSIPYLMISIVGFIIVLIFFNYFEFDKLQYYFDNSDNEFNYSLRHLIYFLLSISIFYYSKNFQILKVSVLGVIMLSIPLYFDNISLFYERILILFTPFLSLAFGKILSQNFRLRQLTIIPICILCIYIMNNNSSILFYPFVSNGNIFSIENGILYNIYYR